MAKNDKYNPGKQARLTLIREKYMELKGKQNELLALHAQMARQEALEFRHQFGDMLQAFYDDDTVPYDISVAEIMEAMGTTSRKTVNDFLGDARKRKMASFVTALGTSPYRIVDAAGYSDLGPRSYFEIHIQQPDHEHVTILRYQKEKWYFDLQDFSFDEDGTRHSEGPRTRLNYPLDNKATDVALWIVQQPEFTTLYEQFK